MALGSRALCCAAASLQGRRAYQEDRWAVEGCGPDAQTWSAVGRNQQGHLWARTLPHPALVGVFDGHGGATASDLCASRLLPKCRALAGPGPVPAVALAPGFAAIEEQLTSEDCDTCGTTAVVLSVSASHVVCANVGDSRAVLGRKSAPGGCVELSSDHKPDRPDERARVTALGGFVRQSRGDCPRVWGPDGTFGLAMSRALGDFALKAKGSQRDLLSPEPELVTQELQADDEFVILATDGLWDVMSSSEACEMVREERRKERAPAEGADDTALACARELVSQAYHLGSADNITALVVLLDVDAAVQLSKM